ncbi:LysR family transcriptional regulator [Pseudomonas sp. 5P_3.1_Bac2]|uniref:LysR family transcriptional regulator n=1 Tax=Pseudomonas sp. 5P_3.1_Bac2 TaxID=2971617 RepID=UPI0021C7D2DB|nr:LysR family transcriptional regulator [Pseudomonas sp. 5P_3.1_Bac2]MCU1716790.1 LysR family transcriptional regulator [Pseudomonas sp. 5P_3.1_Bac2]
MDYFAALTAFVEAAQTSNFSSAAEHLGIKASTVSRYIRDLEQDLGIALFNRSTRKLHLTEGGETFLARARVVLSELEQAKAATSALNQHPRGVLKLNLPPAFCRLHVLPLLKDFCAQYPEIKLELVLDNSTVNLIDAGVDLAIRIGTLAESGLKARKLADEHMRLCVSPQFANQQPIPTNLSELSRLPLILGTSVHDPLTLITDSRQLASKTADILRISDLEARLIAAKQGLGVALLPDWLADAAIRRGELHSWQPEREPLYSAPPTAIWFVYPPKRIVSSKVRCFIDFVLAQLGPAPDWSALS